MTGDITDESRWTTVRRLAHDHLDAPTAERWLGLVRPAVHLLTDVAPDAGLPLVGRLGGLPTVPRDFAWPTWDGHGPLPLIAEIDLEAVASAGLDPGLALPGTGRLLAFYYDPTALESGEDVYEADDDETRDGTRLVHLDGDVEAWTTADPPAGLHVYPVLDLRGHQTASRPRWEDAALVAAFAGPGHDPDEDHERWMEHPVNGEAFDEALEVALRAPGLGPDDVPHQLGGWAHAVQLPPESEVSDQPLAWRPVLQVGSEPRLGPTTGCGSEESYDENGDFVDIDDSAGFDEDGFMIGMPRTRGEAAEEPDMTWGDMGALYWLVRADDSTLGDVRFTWQC